MPLFMQRDLTFLDNAWWKADIRESEFFPILLHGVCFHLLIWLTKSPSAAMVSLWFQWLCTHITLVPDGSWPWCCPWGAGSSTGTHRGQGVPGAMLGYRPEQVGTTEGQGRCTVCPAQHSWVGNCFHLLCFKGRLLLSRADKEEADLQSLSNVALIGVTHLDGAEVKRRRPYGVTFIFVKFRDKPLIW